MLPYEQINTDHLDVAMYWGKDNYIGECSVPLSEFELAEEQENVLQVGFVSLRIIAVERKVV